MDKKTKKVISITISEELHTFMKEHLNKNSHETLSSWISKEIHELSSSVAKEHKKMLDTQKDIYAGLRKLEREAEEERERFRNEFKESTERLKKEEADALIALHKMYDADDASEGCPVDPDVLKSSASIFSRLEDEKKKQKYAVRAKKIRDLSNVLARELMKILQDDDE